MSKFYNNLRNNQFSAPGSGRVSTAKKSLRVNFNQLRVALFYDWLNQWGGAERVLLDILKIFPQAPIYTLVHHPQKTQWLPPKTKVVTSFLQSFPNTLNNPIYYTPLYPLAAEQFDFSEFDIVISTTTTIGHSLLTPPQTLYLCYFHNINRRIYPSSFPLSLYQKIDQIYAHRPDHLLVSSKNVRQKIKKYYQLPATLVYPGIDISSFKPIKNPKSNYFLTVSRLVPHKKVDLAIKACQQLNLPLKIIGTGRHLSYLKQIAGSNTEFLGQVSQQKLINLYQNCTALICPQHEDFGLTPIEAMACGRPVIAYSFGGFLETIINGKTGLFFNHQTVSGLTKALEKFNITNFKPAICRRQAVKFSRHRFMLNFKQIVKKLWHQHQQTIT